MSTPALQDDNKPTERVWTVEEFKEDLLLTFRALLRNASGIKNQSEYDLLYRKTEREFGHAVDFLIHLASKDK